MLKCGETFWDKRNERLLIIDGVSRDPKVYHCLSYEIDEFGYSMMVRVLVHEFELSMMEKEVS